jgi:hypothetical protein
MFSGGVLRPQGINTDSMGASATRETALVCLSTGYLFFTKDWDDWTLRWVNTTSTADPLYIGYGNYSAVKMAFDYFYLAQLPAPFNADASFLTDSNAAPVATDTFTHEADFVASVVLDYAAAEQSIINIREQNSSNNWIIQAAASGTAYLRENVAGSWTVRDTSAGAFAAGNTYTLTIVASGTTIRVFKDGTEILTNTSATNFSSETSGTFAQVGASCSFSDLYVYPRIQGAALAAALDSFIP